jgi:hypothetical protein
MVDTLKVEVMGKGPLIYRSNPAMCQISYSDGLETDGTFGEVAKRAWAAASGEWRRYGDTDIPTSFKDPFTNDEIAVRLNDKEMRIDAVDKLRAQIEAMQPGLGQKLAAKKREELSPSQREALDTPFEKRTGKQVELARQAAAAIQVTPDEVARSIVGPNRKEAIQLAKEIVRNAQMIDHIDIERGIVNFEYWRMRIEAEQYEELLRARKLVFQGDQAYANNDLVAARNFYEQGLVGWRKALDKYPLMGDELAAGDDLLVMVKRYARILSQLDEPFPEKFILQDVVDAMDPEKAAQAKLEQEEKRLRAMEP